MLRANIKLTRREEGILRSMLERTGRTFNGYVKAWLKEQIKRIIEEEALLPGREEING